MLKGICSFLTEPLQCKKYMQMHNNKLLSIFMCNSLLVDLLLALLQASFVRTTDSL